MLKIKHLSGEPENYGRMQYAIVINDIFKKYSLHFFENISIGNYEIGNTEYSKDSSFLWF